MNHDGHDDSVSIIIHHYSSSIIITIIINWLVVSNMNFIYHNIWDVIRNPLTNSIIFQDGYKTTNQIS
jgi:uncharacterized protein (DUF2062 family)